MNSLQNQFRKKIHKTVKQRKINVLQLYGSLTSQKRLLPEFIIIGSQRSGTTSLYNYLAGHPYVLPAIVKEVHYFDLAFNNGFNWYRGHFPFTTNGKDGQRIITGEASPYYIFHPHAPGRIARIFPGMKIILLLRNPVDRAFSHYQHEASLGFERLPFDEAVEKESSRLQGEIEKMEQDENYRSFNHQHYSYLSRGIYADQVKTWMKYFPKEQMRVIQSEELFDSPQMVLSKVWKFLDLPDRNLPSFRVHNRQQYQGMPAATRERLHYYFRPFNQCLYDVLETDFGWND